MPYKPRIGQLPEPFQAQPLQQLQLQQQQQQQQPPQQQHPKLAHTITSHTESPAFTSISPPDVSGAPKKRVSKACDHCRKRKIKCDDVKPRTGKCSNCTKFNAECTFDHHNAMEKKRKAHLMSTAAAATADAQTKRVKQQTFQPLHKDICQEQSQLQSRDQDVTQKDSALSLQCINEKLESLESKMSAMVDWILKLDSLGKRCTDFLEEQRARDAKNQSLTDKGSLPKKKQYSTSLLTKRKINWIKNELATRGQKTKDGCDPASCDLNSFFKPLEKMLSISSKWYVIQLKKIMDLSNPYALVNHTHLYPLPPKERCERILEVFYSKVLSSETSILDTTESKQLFEKYYSGVEKLSYSELFLINVVLCLGSSYCTVDQRREENFVRKDRVGPTVEELRAIEENTLLNSIYYFHKITIVCDGIKPIQGMLLLYQYMRTNLSVEIGYSIFATAVRFAQDMSLHNLDTYKRLSYKECLKRRILWWHCYTTDKFLSLKLCKPSLINERDMTVLTDESYVALIKEQLLPQVGTDREAIDQITTIEEALKKLEEHCSCLPVFISYYTTKLARLSSKIYYSFFTPTSLKGQTFDAMIDRVLEIKNSLADWEKYLPGSIRLENYRQYLSMMYCQYAEGNPAVNFSVFSMHVLNLHFEHLYLAITTNLFACSFFLDNENLHDTSRHNVKYLKHFFAEQGKDYCIKTLLLSKTVEFSPNLYDRMLYNFFTSVFVLCLFCFKYIDLPQTAEHISILCEIHGVLTAANSNAVSVNMKWNVSMFVFTFFLIGCIKHFNRLSPVASHYNFTTEGYEKIMQELAQGSEEIKNKAVADLVTRLKSFSSPMNKKYADGSTDLESHDTTTTPQTISEHTFSNGVPRVLNIFNELDMNDLQSLESSMPINLLSEENGNALATNNGIKPEQTFYNDGSLFPEMMDNYTDVLDTTQTVLGSMLDPQQLPDGNPPGSELSNHEAEFEQLLENTFLYDREFSFPSGFRNAKW